MRNSCRVSDQWRRLGALLVAVLVLSLGDGAVRAQGAATLEVKIAIVVRQKPPPPLYDLTAVPQDEALQGARLAIQDNNTTGRFLGQHFGLEEVVLGKGQSPAEAARKLVDKGVGLILVDLPAEQLLAVSDALKGRDAVLFNVAAEDNSLRGKDCRANIFHVAPSRAMLTDALGQFLLRKRWTRLFLVHGKTPADKLYAKSVRHSAKKFGLDIVAEKPWTYGPLAQARGDNITEAAALDFTQGYDFDVLVVADEEDNFGDYLLYHTRRPKLVVGTQGLIAASWHKTQFAFGSEQLQDRFLLLAHRHMRPIDYQAWVATRAIGAAVVHLKSGDPRAIAAYMITPGFDLAAFKGVAVSFRPWDHQLREPLLLAQPAFLVAIAPLPGFLHQHTTMDTLGVDQPESQCHM